MKRKSCDSFSKDRTQADEEQKRNNSYLPLPLENIFGIFAGDVSEDLGIYKCLQKIIEEITLDQINLAKLWSVGAPKTKEWKFMKMLNQSFKPDQHQRSVADATTRNQAE